MKIPQYIKEMLIAFFKVLEEKYLPSNTPIKVLSSPFYPYEKGLDHMLIREYYPHGLRFLIFLTPTEIYLYLRAEYIGGYSPGPNEKPLSTNMPVINGFIPFFSEKISHFTQFRYESIFDSIYEHMEQMSERKNYKLNNSLRLDEMRNKFKKNISSLLQSSDELFGTLPREEHARNPFTLKLFDFNDGVWFTRTYQTVTLLFGMRDNKLYIFCDKKTLEQFDSTMGLMKPPQHLYIWTIIHVEEFNEEHKDKLLTNASFILLDFAAQLLVKDEKEKNNYVNALSDN